LVNKVVSRVYGAYQGAPLAYDADYHSSAVMNDGLKLSTKLLTPAHLLSMYQSREQMQPYVWTSTEAPTKESIHICQQMVKLAHSIEAACTFHVPMHVIGVCKKQPQSSVPQSGCVQAGMRLMRFFMQRAQVDSGM